jgi:Na+-transporting methylmalonyl-CoA/oxaloacetate decarboxylase gamma subunit
MSQFTLLLIDSGALTRGVSIAIAGLSIVFTALLLISLFIASLPHVLAIVARVWPEMEDKQTHQSHPESLVPDNGAVLAAIGFVLHTEVRKQLAAEDTSAVKS